MDLRLSPSEREFQRECDEYFEGLLSGDFAHLRARGGPGDEHSFVEERAAFEKRLGTDGYTALGWPTEHGGRALPLNLQVIFYESYARAKGPGRLGHIGEGLLAPTLIHFGTPEQQQRFLPGIKAGTEFWCQGYSEPNAGSDLANVSTKAYLDDQHWVINGQKVWTSLAQFSQWCFVVARTDPNSSRHHGLSYLLVPMNQPGIEIRPIYQLTGTAEFNEVFFDDARTEADLVVGGQGDGWKVAMGTLSFERGASTLGQQFAFLNELKEMIELNRDRNHLSNPLTRQKLANAWVRLEIMRLNTLRTLSESHKPELSGASYIAKLYWARLHRDLGELYVDSLGAGGMLAAQPSEGLSDTHHGGAPDLGRAQRLFLFTRSDTIYGGANQIQRNIIGERALGLPREPR